MLSMGGQYLRKWPELDSSGNPKLDQQGRQIMRYTAKPYEVSLVDRGCCSSCVMSFANKVYEIRKTGAATKVAPVIPFAGVHDLPTDDEDECDPDQYEEGECDMTRQDHEDMAKRHAQFAEHHSELTKLHKAATEHHLKMDKAAPATFGEAAMQSGSGMGAGASAGKAYGRYGEGSYINDNDDRSGGLRKSI